MTDTERLNEAIANAGVSITFLADKCGISRTALYQKINNDVEFRQSEIAKVTEVLHITGEERDLIFFTLERE